MERHPIELGDLLAALAELTEGTWHLLDAIVPNAPGVTRDDLINARTNAKALARTLGNAQRSYSSWRQFHDQDGQTL